MEPVAVVGSTIQLLRLLGRGGMGTVWLGRRNGDVVAVKMMLPRLVGEPLAVARFERELRILDRLRSRHAVRLISAGNHFGQPYAVMDNVDGGSLADRFEINGKPPTAIAFRVIAELLAALGEVHAEGVIHRDVKPANIMLSGGDDALEVTLVDFGVASSREEPSIDPNDEAVTVGTGPYMSPEQLVEGGAGTIHEDMWAAAVVAYESLMGRMPFDGPSYAAVCIAVTCGVFLPPTLVCPDLPPSADAWFSRAFARKIEDRFASAVEMAAAWDAVARELPASVRPAVWSTTPPASEPKLAISRTHRDLRPATTPKRGREASRRDEHMKSWSIVAAAAAMAALVVVVASEVGARLGTRPAFAGARTVAGAAQN